MIKRFWKIFRHGNFQPVLFSLFVTTTFLPFRNVLNYSSASRFGWFAEPLAISFYFADVFFFLLFLSALINFPRLKPEQFLLWLAIFTYFLAQALRNADSSLGIYNFLRLIQFFVLFYFSANLFSNKTIRIYGAIILVAIGLFQTTLGAYQVTTGHSLGVRYLGEQTVSRTMAGVAKVNLDDGVKLLRAYGTMPHPNILGGFLVLTLGANLVLLKTFPHKRRIIILSGAILIFGILLTFSRSAYLATFLLAILWLRNNLFSQNMRVLKTILPIFLGIILIFGLFAPLGSALWHRIFPTNADMFISDRIILATNGAKIISNNLLFGVGLGNYINSLVKLAPVGSSLKNWQYDYPHNVFAELQTELGIYGLMVFFYALLKILNNTKKNKKSILIPLIIIAPLLLLDHYLWTNQSGRVMLVLYILFLPYLWQNERNSSPN